PWASARMAGTDMLSFVRQRAQADRSDAYHASADLAAMAFHSRVLGKRNGRQGPVGGREHPGLAGGQAVGHARGEHALLDVDIDGAGGAPGLVWARSGSLSGRCPRRPDVSWLAGSSSPATASIMVMLKRSLLRRTTWMISMSVLLGLGGLRLPKEGRTAASGRIARSAAISTRRLRRPCLPGAGRKSARGTACLWRDEPPPNARGLGPAHAARAADRPPSSQRAVQPRNRAATIHLAPNGWLPPPPDLPQAPDHLPQPAPHSLTPPGLNRPRHVGTAVLHAIPSRDAAAGQPVAAHDVQRAA